MTTETALEAITDTGAFEKLAVGILRAADPATYQRLIHLGMNAEGKTIPGPVDGYVSLAAGPKLVFYAATTISLQKLESKWLHPESGDVTKGIAAVERARAAGDTRPAVLALATNRSPPIDMVQRVGAACDAASVELDLWERSRLAMFLDADPTGHWFRQQALGIKAARLSLQLLQGLGERSLRDYRAKIPGGSGLAPRSDLASLAARVQAPGLTVLSAASGLGKTAVCIQLMKSWHDLGRPAIWLSEQLIDAESNLDAALRRALADLHGAVLEGSALQAAGPLSLLAVMDDLAACRDPIRTLEKMIAWAQTADSLDSTAPARRVHILVPTWPEFLVQLRQDLGKELAPHVFELRPLSAEEAIDVYRQRSRDQLATNEEARQIVERLGHDPLLIDLFDPSDRYAAPEDVVWSWIERELRGVAQRTGVPTTAHKSALLAVAKGMLRHRSLTPSLQDVAVDITSLVSASKIVRWNAHADGSDRLVFRHDRVRDALLAEALAEIATESPEDDVLSDPFYAELFGTALVRRRFNENLLALAAHVAPLALFAALKASGRAGVASHHGLLEAISAVLHQQGQQQTLPDAFLWRAGYLLSETNAPETEKLCDQFPVRSFWLIQARVRNGNVEAAIDLARGLELGLSDPRDERLIAQAAQRYPEFIRTIAERLTTPEMDAADRAPLVLLAGYIGDVRLQDAIGSSFSRSPPRGKDEVEAALWAVVRCCQSKLASMIDVVLDGFALLSSVPAGDSGHSERGCVLFGWQRIARELPATAAIVLVDRCARRADIREDLTYVIRHVDHPDAMRYLVSTDASRERACKQSGQAFHRIGIGDPWDQRLFRINARRMSPASRQCLQEIWTEHRAPIEDRSAAFHLWQMQLSAADLPLLQRITAGDPLGDRALKARVRLADRSAFPAFLERIDAHDRWEGGWWWFDARGVMDEQLVAGIDRWLAHYNGTTDVDPGAHIVSELIMELHPDIAASLLLKHWSLLQQDACFVQAALYVDSRETRAAADAILHNTENPSVMLEHVLMHFGVNTEGRRERVTLMKLDALVPYLDHLKSSEISSLWHACNDRGWFDWRKRHVDARVTDPGDPRLATDVASREALLNQIENPDHVYSQQIDREFLSIGYSLEEAFTIVTAWARKIGTAKAITIAAWLFIHEASRAQLSHFHSLVADRPEFALLAAQVDFAVKCRTLS